MDRPKVQRGALLAALLVCAFGAAAEPVTNPPLRISDGVRVLLGQYAEGSQPDGNSVLLKVAEGLVVVDSGRYAGHAQRIIELAKAESLPIVALINTHWHLDHVSGNPVLVAAYPGLPVYASNAIATALQGFLANYRKQLVYRVEQSEAHEGEKDKWRDEIARIDAGAQLLPNHPVDADEVVTLGGTELHLKLETHGVSGGDVWIYDSASRVLIAGDLVTLPVPFLDTACPSGWSESLHKLAEVDFERLVPGHGLPMDQAGLKRYVAAFDQLLACADSDAAAADCAQQWREGLGSELLPADEQRRSDEMLNYYIGQLLRGPKARQYCR